MRVLSSNDLQGLGFAQVLAAKLKLIRGLAIWQLVVTEPQPDLGQRGLQRVGSWEFSQVCGKRCGVTGHGVHAAAQPVQQQGSHTMHFISQRV